jgi:YVTN family beta-propeller protein
MLRPLGAIDLPPHRGQGGFDHAAIDRGRSLLYVAHTANDALDVIDTRANRHVRSIGSLEKVAGALVDEPTGTVFTSNRGENTVGILDPDAEVMTKVSVGIRPNGLAYDRERELLLCANVGDPSAPGSAGITLVDTRSRQVRKSIVMPGRTRWAVYDADSGLFFVNIMDPSLIVAVDPVLAAVTRCIEVAARGPHGLDLEPTARRLYCACDDGTLMAIDTASGDCAGRLELSGGPDVVFLDRDRSRLYVAIGDPGVIDVIDIAGWKRDEVVPTEPGAHTIALDLSSYRVFAFCPATHRALIFAGD